ncbi:Helitron helicase [Phytophthora megakarya]|uniref:Helitron helicase n=1 Tax=Phytophthora megakarya TaxID=4795 RepID=A0A225WBE8_9STRA|nr:Helitron helicase [Phytophthora megakarya]
MIRYLNSDDGLGNRTRLHVVTPREKCVDTTIMTGPRRSKRVFIPRIVFFSDDEDKEFPFPMRPFAMTRSQGQSIHHVGIYLLRILDFTGYQDLPKKANTSTIMFYCSYRLVTGSHFVGEDVNEMHDFGSLPKPMMDMSAIELEKFE